MDFLGGYSIPTLLEVAAKVVCIIHLIRTGRSMMWIWLILFFPVGGVLIYFFVEVFPELRSGGRSRTREFKLPQTSGRTIAKLKDELEFSNTVRNRVRLAQAYASAKRFPEAIETLNTCLQGLFKDDPLLVYELAQIQLAAGNYQVAWDGLLLLDRLKSRHEIPERMLLAARCQDALGDLAAAQEIYAKALELSSGEEARCRYALLLEKLGRTAEARGLFTEVVGHGKRADGRYRRANREWISTAKARLAV